MFSPGIAGRVQFCGEVSVLAFRDTQALPCWVLALHATQLPPVSYRKRFGLFWIPPTVVRDLLNLGFCFSSKLENHRHLLVRAGTHTVSHGHTAFTRLICGRNPQKCTIQRQGSPRLVGLVQWAISSEPPHCSLLCGAAVYFCLALRWSGASAHA